MLQLLRVAFAGLRTSTLEGDISECVGGGRGEGQTIKALGCMRNICDSKISCEEKYTKRQG